MKKYIEDSKNKPREKVRITRSVGLQVGIALLSLQQQREEEEQQAKIKLNAAGSRIATKPAPARDSLTNGVVRVAANSPAKNSEARPASGLGDGAICIIILLFISNSITLL